MLPWILGAHNIMRWLVLLAGTFALMRAYRGWLAAGGWQPQDDLAGRLFAISFDIQFLVGLFTAAVSPMIRTALQNPATISASQSIRYFAVEHIPLMVVALAAVHITSSLVKKAEVPAERHKRAAIGYSLGFLLILMAIPWWRPLLPSL
ncbi:MAG TPA: hypothetical protein VGA52_16010 [Anaerolineales bacterium]|jgi:cytochrome c biogenesis factor